MDIKPIKNERKYRKALKEIESLMDARPNTADGDRLDVLVTLIQAWEEKHWPIDFNASPFTRRVENLNPKSDVTC